MNKTDIIKFLDERIQYFTGGDEMKSMAESCTDEHIVNELKKVRDFIIGKPKRCVGVISQTIEMFLRWKEEHGFVNIKRGDTQRKFIVDDTTYVCISQPQHACGYDFDEVTRSDGAWRNKDFDRIVDYCRVALKKEGTWDI